MRIVFFGDSLSKCGGPGARVSDVLARSFPDHEFINRATDGRTLDEARELLQKEALDLQPDLLVLQFGANDWWRDNRPYQQWAADLDYMLEKSKRHGVRCLVLGVFGKWRDPLTGKLCAKTWAADERSEAFSALEEQAANKHGAYYVSNHQSSIINDRCCWNDRNHPNELGNRRIAADLETVFSRILGQKPVPGPTARIENLRDFWEEAVKYAPKKTAAVCGERMLTFAEADLLTKALGAGISRLCQVPNPKIAVCLPNCLEYFLLYWATMKIGGIIVPINPWLKKDSLEAIYANVRPNLLVAKNPIESKEALLAKEKFPALPLVYLDEQKGAQSFQSLHDHNGYCPRPDISAATPAIIMHTSGTTAAPKGAVMLHGDLIFNCMTTIKAHDFTHDDVHLLINPMFHCTALYSSLPVAAWQKTPLVISAEPQAEELLELIAKHQITSLLTVPTVLQRIVSLPDKEKYNLQSLRVVGYAGSFMPVKIVRELQKLVPQTRLHNFFGLTETISATHLLPAEAVRKRPDSIGQLLPFVSAIIINEQKQECTADEVGELLFARDNVISGYWNKPGLLEESMIELRGRSWFRTGDLASRDEEGYFFIKGRKKDMIIVGGENVFAVEVETCLLALPGIHEAAVVGIPASGLRAALGELIKAFIVLEKGATLGETDIRRHCHKNLPSYKIPHHFEFLNALPRNQAGKIQKEELKKHKTAP
ncbi:MAG: AMP-binding protein [Oligosphaeraceae bacterium]|nr:AMP-binding protein [Oligosphaeraceae bacterium]